jgi:hydroxymethylglutaryl-CoA reductase (NADPH)
MQVPSFMLKKLYKKGSLRNGAEGLEFTLENSLSTVSLTKLEKVTVDGQDFPADQVEVALGGEFKPASGFSQDEPITFARSATMTCRIKGFQADASVSHAVVLEATARGMGLLKVEIGDLINA